MPENPYAVSDITDFDVRPPGRTPLTFFSAFRVAIQLLCSNILLFSAIILTVWLPGNVFVNYLIYHGDVDVRFMIRAPMLIESIFGPIYIGALVFALAKVMQGEQPSYGESINVGFQKWGSLFAARFIAGCIILLGLIAFIIPGIIFSVRYALLDPVVVLENADSTTARSRSTELTVGVRWQIFGSAVLFFVCFILFSFAIYLPTAYVPNLDNMWTGIVLDCVVDIVYAVLIVVLFLYYWHGSQSHGRDENEPDSEVLLA